MFKKTIIFSALIIAFGVFAPLGIDAQPNKRQVERANRLAKEGADALFRKNYRVAVEKYFQATSIIQNFPEAYFNKAFAHYYLKEYAFAIKDFDTALAQGHRPLDIYKIRWFIYYTLKDFPPALRDVEEGLKLAPEDSYLQLALGDIYRAQLNFKQAAAAYSKASELDSQNADTHYYLALCYAELKDYEKQGLAAAKALQAGTQYKAASFNYAGQAFAHFRKYQEAAEALEQALAIKPDLADAYAVLGDSYRNLNRYEDAIAVAKKAIARYPLESSFQVSLSWYASLANKHQEAVNAAIAAIKIAPQERMAYTNLCRSYNDLKQYKQAIEACSSALKIDSTDGETYLYLGRAYELNGQADLATKMFEKSVPGLLSSTKENPDSPDGFYLLGNAYYANDQKTKAIGAYLKCLDISPGFSKARYNLGFIYTLIRDKPSAQKQYDALLKIDPALAEKLSEAIKKMK